MREREWRRGDTHSYTSLHIIQLQEDDLVYYVPTAAASLAAAKPKGQSSSAPQGHPPFVSVLRKPHLSQPAVSWTEQPSGGVLSRLGLSESKQPQNPANGKSPNGRFAQDYRELFFVRRRSTRTHPDQGSPLINWEHTFYLNLLMQYFRYSVSCTIAQRDPPDSNTYSVSDSLRLDELHHPTSSIPMESLTIPPAAVSVCGLLHPAREASQAFRVRLCLHTKDRHERFVSVHLRCLELRDTHLSSSSSSSAFSASWPARPDSKTVLTWPRIYFTLDDFERLFEEFVLAPDQVLLVRLHVHLQNSSSDELSDDPSSSSPSSSTPSAPPSMASPPPAAQSRQVCLFSGSVRHSEFVDRVVACERADQEARRGIGQRLRTLGRQLFAEPSTSPSPESSPAADGEEEEEAPMQFQLGKRRYIHLRGPKRVGFAHVAVGLADPAALKGPAEEEEVEEKEKATSSETPSPDEDSMTIPPSPGSAPAGDADAEQKEVEEKAEEVTPDKVRRIVEDYLGGVFHTVRTNVLTFHKNRARLHALFMEQDPDRLGEVNDLLHRFRGQEESLFRSLYLEYKLPMPQGDLAVSPEKSFLSFSVAPGTPSHPPQQQQGQQQSRKSWADFLGRKRSDSGQVRRPSSSVSSLSEPDRGVITVKPSEAHVNVMLTWIHLDFEEIIDKVLRESFPDIERATPRS